MLSRLSLMARTRLAVVLAVLLTAGLAAVALGWFQWRVAIALAIVVGLPLALWLASTATKPWTDTITALKDGVASLRDHDFSLSIARGTNDELGDLVEAYNSLGAVLRRERLDLHQRELMLDTVIQTSPLALVLTNANARIVFSNISARQLLGRGRKLEGLDFGEVLKEAPGPLREAIAGGTDTLFTIQEGAEANVFHVAQRRFVLNAQEHRLVLLKQLTRELAAQEVAVWKKVIRVIAHELNNSLAPISSLANSGLMLARASAEAERESRGLPAPARSDKSAGPGPGEAGGALTARDSSAAGRSDEVAPSRATQDAERLERVFTTIAGRAAHLATFIDGYARFAKLPKPRLVDIDWKTFITRLEGSMSFRLTSPVPAGAARFDATQLEQVMINLLKNAAESGSAPEAIELAVRAAGDGWMLEVADRGTGLSDDTLRDALIPFYSTKPSGTGLGLTLCREIVEAHAGRLSIANRPGGGAVVALWLPALPDQVKGDSSA
jgi:nitrogen fixation/metabolism regulation signal transduction histidine kinase